MTVADWPCTHDDFIEYSILWAFQLSSMIRGQVSLAGLENQLASSFRLFRTILTYL